MALEVTLRRMACFVAVLAALVRVDAVAAQRTPLTPVELTKIEYQPGGTHDRFNPDTKQWEKVSLERAIVYDEATGNFLLQWNGLDGKRKTIVYRPATRLHAVVVAQVERDATGKGFRYVYAARNLPASQRELQSLYIETKATADSVESPGADWGYSRPLTQVVQKALDVESGWAWSYTAEGRQGLLPGESDRGFAYHSEGLPGIVRCFARQRAGMKGVGEEPPEELMAALDPFSWVMPNGVTVGPVAPLERIEPSEFLKNIDAMIDVSVQQGWILSPSLAQELRSAVKGAVTSLEQENGSGQATLRDVLKRVEGERDKALLSEAYALLRYNLEFLLSRLEPTP